ncbi:phosphodiester glycosidase family protein [Paenibacillus hodogayensis]|uniref:Phosphodiester glycosidase family protein n=1 Tax=Paenibacillus hodogayensis TaxID=279208 RepID=A0ABV5VVW2_9BACL
MSTATQIWASTRRELGGWSWFKKTLLIFALLIFATSSFLYLTPPGLAIREFLAQTVISTQHRDWAWIVVGKEKRNYMVKMSHQFTETSALEKQDMDLIKHDLVRKERSVEELISEPIEISGQFWKGKMIYVYDPTSIRVVVPNKVGEGERISSMAIRTGAVAGINGGGFIDPDGLGNGFAPIGLIMSGYEPIFADVEADTAQHIIGFTHEGTLVVGKYSLLELQKMGVKEAVSFVAPRLIANGNGQITSGDGGWGRAPRTAIGQKKDGTLIFVIIDGRQTSSVGATLKEVQDLLLKEGAVNAGLLDGGASSELVVKGEVLTKPSSRYGERRLPSGILVYDDPDSYKADRIWDGLNKIDPGGRYDHPDFLKEQAEQKKQQQSQPQKTEPDKTQAPGQTDKPKEPAKNEQGGTGAKTTTPPKTENNGGAASDKDKPGGTTPDAGKSGTPAGNGAGAGAPASGGAGEGTKNTPATGGNAGQDSATPPAGSSSGQGGATPPAGGSSGQNSATPPAGGSSGQNNATPPAGGSSGQGSATPPAGGSSGQGSATPPAGGSSGQGSATPPAGGSSGQGSATPPAGGSSGQNSATPPAGGSSGQNSATPPAGGSSGQGSATPPAGGNAGQAGATPPAGGSSGQGSGTPPAGGAPQSPATPTNGSGAAK